MLILLPPSETKRPGGGGLPLINSWNLSFAELDETRRMLAGALRDLSADPVATAKALKLGPKQVDEVAVNASLFDSATMPALERFTGVLYDAIDVDSLDDAARYFLDTHVLIQSALFGLVQATDEIPAYRLSYDSRIPGMLPLKKIWQDQSASILERRPELILDLRSEGYAALTPLPVRANAFFVRAMGRTPDGKLRQLNHFNKKGKGVFVRALAETMPTWATAQNQAPPKTSPGGVSVHDVETLLSWATSASIELTRTEDPHVLQLVINEADYPPLNAIVKPPVVNAPAK
jgi:cytoplasmic iron level regulating protein YaaA (DUF328/UPF0246 family)